jgi:hypothetical protein
MCRSKSEGGRRCPGGGHARTESGLAAEHGPAARQLAADLGAAAAQLCQGGDAQYALEQTVGILRRAYVNAGRLGSLDERAEGLRAQMLGVAETIDATLGDELADRRYLREDAESTLRDLAAAAGASPPARAAGISEDDADYLQRAAELDRRVAAGESITDILRARQLEQGEAMIRAMAWP